MSVIFRQHRGGLKEAMDKAKEFGSVEEMKEYICNDHNYSVGDFEQETYRRGYEDGMSQVAKYHNTSKKLIIEKIKQLEQEPKYQHEGEDWMSGLIMAEEIIERYL